jgi:FMN phosphatase YigB (HAD superfamily)
MKFTVRAVICDVYGTLLSVAPGPADAGGRWERLWGRYFESPAALDWAGLGRAIEAAVRAEHAAARAVGIAYPEVAWEPLMTGVLPAVANLAPREREEFLFGQAGIWHEVGPMAGVAAALKAIRDSGALLGIASNAQPYTLRELAGALAGSGIGMDDFASDLCFWSFAHGFSKPDPHVFRILGARLRARGIAPGETLMIGDRMDNDVEPARAQGWQTWRLGEDAGEGKGPGGGLERVRALVGGAVRPPRTQAGSAAFSTRRWVLLGDVAEVEGGSGSSLEVAQGDDGPALGSPVSYGFAEGDRVRPGRHAFEDEPSVVIRVGSLDVEVGGARFEFAAELEFDGFVPQRLAALEQATRDAGPGLEGEVGAGTCG